MRTRFGSLWGIAACLVLGTRLVAAQTVTQVSTLTSTTTGETLLLTTSVIPSTAQAGRFDWRFSLQNPVGNTVRINSFTAAPRVDLSGLLIVRSPVSWVPASVSDAGVGKVVWNWLPDNPSNPTNLAAQLDPGETFIFEMQLRQGGVPNGGDAAANNSHGFTGKTVGAAGGPADVPPGAIPEPATMSLLGVGLLPLAALLKRRSR